MTGREVLIQQLIDKGATAAQLKSKLIDLLLEVIAANSEDETMRAALDSLEQQRKKAEEEMVGYSNLRHRYEDLLAGFHFETAKERQDMYDAKSAARTAEYRFNAEKQKYEEMYAELSKAETAEARDRIRMAIWFRENTDVNTKYDNTAFINGLGAILGGTAKKEENA